MRLATLIGGWRSRRVLGALGAFAICLAAVAGLVLTGSREPAAAVRLLSGDAWLGNSANGTVTHVNGLARQAGATKGVVHPGDPFVVVQGPDGALILDRKTGAVEKVGTADEDVTATGHVADPAGTQIVTGGSTTWSVDGSSGVVQQLNPTTLKPQGPPVPLGGPTGTAVVDPNGTLWVPVPVQGAVWQIPPGPGKAVSHHVGASGDQISVALVATGAWAVDLTSGSAAALPSSGAAGPSVSKVSFAPAAGASDHPAVGSSPTSGDVVVVDGSNVEIIDTGSSALSTLADQAVNGVTQLAVNGTTAYLLNTVTNQLITVNLSTSTAGTPVTLGPGPNQIVTDAANNMVFVNSPNTPNAYIVGPNGQPIPITKYATDPNAAPTPTPSPVVSPALTPVGTPSPLVGSPAPGLSAPVSGPTAPVAGPGAPAGLVPTGSSGAAAGPAAVVPVGSSGSPLAPVAAPSPAPAAPAPAGPAPAPAPSPPPTPSVGPPGAPFVSAGPAAGAIVLTWAAPAANGSPITGYVVHGPTAASANETVNALTVTISGLPPGTQACATVQAVSAAGSSPVSNQACATPASGLPPAPAAVQDSCSGLTCTVSWSAVSGATGYVVKDSDGQSQQVGAGTLTASFHGVAGHQYSFTVQAVNQYGAGPAAQGSAVSTGSAPSPGQLAADAGPGQIEVHFSAGSDTGGDPITYAIVLDGSTVKSGASPGQEYDLTASVGTHKVGLILTNAEGSTQTSAIDATSFSTDTITECENTNAALAGNYSYVNINQPNCVNSLAPTQNSGVSFKVPASGSPVNGLERVTDYQGTSPSTGEQTNALSASGTPSSPAGWSWEAHASFSVATSAQPGASVPVEEYRSGIGQYRYVPSGVNPSFLGSGWQRAGVAFYVCST